MMRGWVAAILGLLLVQDGGDGAAEKAKLDEELAKAAEPVAEQLLKWKSWDEARAFLEVIRAKSDARAESLDKLISKTDKQTSGWEWDRRTCELIKQFGKERAKKFYAFARAWKEKDAKLSKWTDTEGEIVDDLVDYTRSYGRLSQVRSQFGLPITRIDWKLSVPALWHARYKLQNPNDQTEIEGKPAYTAEGRKAGTNSISSRAESLSELLEGVVHGPFHRNYALHPGLATIGFGQVRGNDTASVIDVESGMQPVDPTISILLVPRDKATDVPTGGYDDNVRIVEGKSMKDLGYPVSLIFYDPIARVTDVKARIHESNREIDMHLSTPEAPALPSKYPNNRNTILLIPKSRLKPNTTYSVSVQYNLKGQTVKTEWSFKTGR
ncbi:MAG TPA: Ig-like domain-containing protein [Planctomycetota bacterium]|nr:Ig-like domain-containing protein [Planctomycetota bacterium]